MDLKKLYYFEAAATLENFHRAAEQLCITQPALSKQISLLEKELGCQLFIREKRRVQLSPIGEIFLEDARRIIREVDFAVRRVERAVSGQTGTLRIGFRELAGRSPLVSMVFKRFKEAYPNVDLHLSQMTMDEICEALPKDEIHIGLAYSPPSEYKGLSRLTVAEDRLYIAMSQSHHLAGKKRIQMSDLADEPFIWFARNRKAYYIDLLMQRFISGGLSPNIAHEADSEAAIMNLVSLGLGIGPALVASEALAPPGLLFKPVVGLNNRIKLEFVWLDEITSPLVQNFIDISGTVVEESGVGKKLLKE